MRRLLLPAVVVVACVGFAGCRSDDDVVLPSDKVVVVRRRPWSEPKCSEVLRSTTTSTTTTTQPLVNGNVATIIVGIGQCRP